MYLPHYISHFGRLFSLHFWLCFYTFMVENITGKKIIWREFKISSKFRKVFLLAFYTAMILLRTVLNREIWFDPIEKIWGGWGLYEEGQFTTESIENFMLFIPFSILLLWAFHAEVFGESEKIRFRKVIWQATKIFIYDRI